MDLGFSQWCPVRERETMANTETQKLPFKSKEKNLLYCEGGQTLKQVSQRGLLSNFGDIKNMTE